MLLYSVIALAFIVLAGFIWIFNLLVRRWQMVNNGWADIDVQLKRRSDLIPRLVEAVGGYAGHERELFEDIAEKRARVEIAGEDPARRAEAEGALSGPIARLIAVGEAYPDLKASAVFSGLQKELVETENRIEMARRFYNGAVRELNTLAQSFPANMVARIMGFTARAYFEITAPDRLAPQVGLNS